MRGGRHAGRLIVTMHTDPLARIDLDLLRAFHVVMTERHVSRAADRLGMTQPGLSRALARLRELFQDDLLVRAGAAMLPTPRALELHAAVKDLLALIEQRILPVARFDAGSAQREFTTAMSDMAEVVCLPRLVEALRQCAPGCTLRSRRLPTEELTGALESGVIELAIGNVFEPRTNIYQQTLYQHGYVVLACKDNPHIGSTLTLEDYRALPHVVATTGSDDHLQQAGLAPLGIERQVALRVGGILSIPWILPGSGFIATVPAHMARMVTGVLPLRADPLPFEVPPFLLKTYWHPRSHTDPAHRWLREQVYEVLHTYPHWPTQGLR